MFSVGILYSSARFLQIVHETSFTVDGFSKLFRTFDVASAERVLQAVQTCEWVTLNRQGEVVVTKRGHRVLGCSSPATRLRVQLQDMLSATQPTWGSLLTRGRQEAVKGLPPEVHQCFQEADLLESQGADVVACWDQLAKTIRSQRQDANMETGRTGERLSLAYEEGRTGKKPMWQGFESNFAGYDVLSQVSATDATLLRIEVKASDSKPRSAQFRLTRHESKVAAQWPAQYTFHLWALRPSPVLLVVPAQAVAAHSPADGGDGTWEDARVPFTPFINYQVPVSDVANMEGVVAR